MLANVRYITYMEEASLAWPDRYFFYRAFIATGAYTASDKRPVEKIAVWPRETRKKHGRRVRNAPLSLAYDLRTRMAIINRSDYYY